MFSRIAFHKSLTYVIRYNENKVTTKAATLIHANGFLNDKDRLSYQDKYHRFQRQNELNSLAKVNMAHITLSFYPGENLTRSELADISNRFMQGVGLNQQPYLVYEHHDAGHPHVHIVSNTIRHDGSYINLHNVNYRLGLPICKEIEKEFNLERTHKMAQSQQLNTDGIQKVIYGGEKPTVQAVYEVLQRVNKEFKFTSLSEYNAILKQYNVNADRGRPESHLYKHKGLLYFALDEKGAQVSPPLKASGFDFKPTLANLEKKFEENKEKNETGVSSIKRRIDWLLHRDYRSLYNFSEDLRRESIEVVLSHDKQGSGDGLVYIDNTSRIAVTDKELGEDYCLKSLQIRFHSSPVISNIPGVNLKVPQVLCDLSKYDESFQQSRMNRAQRLQIELDQGL